MGIISRLLSLITGNQVKHDFPSQFYADLTIDLTEFQCGNSSLGGYLSDADFFATSLDSRGMFSAEEYGIDLWTKEDVLTTVTLNLEHFPGGFIRVGQGLQLDTETTIDEILALFGEPYWRDNDDDEIILFYEENGHEIQIEFPDRRRLGFITITSRPILADPKQCEAYGVTKPWPPR